MPSSTLRTKYANNNHNHHHHQFHHHEEKGHYLWKNDDNGDVNDLSLLDGSFNHFSGNHNNDEQDESQEEHSKHCRRPSIDSTLTISPIHSAPPPSSIAATSNSNAHAIAINNNLQSIAPAPHPDFIMGKLDIGDAIGSNSANIRRRTQLTSLQVKVLHRVLEHTPFPTKTMRDELATMLGITTKTIQIWFQNQRAKAKQRMRRSRALAALNPTFGGLMTPGQPSMGPVPRMFEANYRRENERMEGHFSDDTNSDVGEEISSGGDKIIESGEFFPVEKIEIPKLPLSPLRPNNATSSPFSLPSPHLVSPPNYHSIRYGARDDIDFSLNPFSMPNGVNFSNCLQTQTPDIPMRRHTTTTIPTDNLSCYSPISMSIEGDSTSWLTSPIMAKTICASPPISPTAKQDIQMIIQVAMREAIQQMDQNKILLAPLTAPHHNEDINDGCSAEQRISKANNDDLFSGLELSNLPGLNSPLFGIDSCMSPLKDLASSDEQSAFGAEIHADFANFLPNL